MTKRLELDGEFSLPDDPATKVTGVVTSSPAEGAVLSLIGSFTDFMNRLNQCPSPSYRRIVGDTVPSGYVTLEDCRLTFENPFGRRQRFVVGKLLVNVAYDADEPVELDRLTVRFSDFTGWLAEGGPRMVPDRTALANGSVPTVAQQIENIQLGSNAQLDLLHRLSCTVDLRSILLRQSSTAAFTFGKPVDLDSALDYAFDLLAAITIAADRVIEFEDISFSHPDLKQPPNSGRASVDLHAQWRAQADSNRKELIGDRMAFAYAHLGGVEGLQRLLVAIQQHRPYVRQVLRARYDAQPTVQDSFFTRVAALEGFDKRRHADEASLRERLGRLASNVAVPFQTLIGKDAIDRWCARMVNLRNNIGHGDAVPLHQSAAELFYMSETAYWLFVLNLLVEGEAPPPVFDHLTTICVRFRWSAKQVQGYC